MCRGGGGGVFVGGVGGGVGGGGGGVFMCGFAGGGRRQWECSTGVFGTSHRVSQTPILRCGGLCGGLVGSTSLGHGADHAAV